MTLNEAISRKLAVERIDRQADEVHDHLFKILSFPRADYYMKHWASEIFGFLKKTRYKLVSTNQYPDPTLFYAHLWGNPFRGEYSHFIQTQDYIELKYEMMQKEYQKLSFEEWDTLCSEFYLEMSQILASDIDNIREPLFALINRVRQR